MINEREQESFLELVRPPGGYRLTYCIGTTFTLELPCLIQMALNSWNRRDAIDELTTHEGFAIIDDFASKAVVFTQNCKIKAPELLNAGNCKQGRFFSLLDSMVAEVPIKTVSSAFHPKAWFLRFDPVEGNDPAIFKLFTMSRNLTSALNWDVSVCLVGKQTGAIGQNANLRAFIKNLSGKSSLRKKNNKIVQRAIQDLESVEFSLPKQSHFKSYDFQFKWAKSVPFPSLPLDGARRAVIISPFLSTSQLAQLKGIRNLYLITSTKDLAKLANFPELHGSTYLLNIEKMELHAKMYLIELDTESQVIIGSTNFTGAGWYGDNIEAHILLKGAKNTVDNFVKAFVLDDKGRVNNWLKRYDPMDPSDDADQKEQQEIKDILDKVQGSLSMGEFNLHYKKGICEIRFEGEPVLLPKGITARLSIIGIDSSEDLAVVMKDMAVFSDVKPCDISSFLIIKLKYKGVEKHFCTVAISNINRSERNKSILSNSICDWGSFWDYLGIILDIEAGTGTRVAGGDRKGRKVKSKRSSVTHIVALQLLEPILLAAVSDNSIISKIDAALAALKTNIKAEMSDKNYQSFLGFWREFKLAHEEFRLYD